MFIVEHANENNSEVEDMNNDQYDEETEHAKGDAGMAQSYEAHKG